MNDNHRSAQYAIDIGPRPSLPVAGSELRFPVGRIYCVGRNYAEHAREMGHDPTREPPFFFMKAASSLAQNNATLAYPVASKDVHHEIEMIVAIGKGGKSIAVDQALAHVWGYGVGLDMTRRDLQGEAKKMGRPWEMGKSFDESAPLFGTEARCRNRASGQGGDLGQGEWQDRTAGGPCPNRSGTCRSRSPTCPTSSPCNQATSSSPARRPASDRSIPVTSSKVTSTAWVISLSATRREPDYGGARLADLVENSRRKQMKISGATVTVFGFAVIFSGCASMQDDVRLRQQGPSAIERMYVIDCGQEPREGSFSLDNTRGQRQTPNIQQSLLSAQACKGLDALG
jgi:hypothetical protein